MDIDKIQHQVSYLLDESYEVSDNFDLLRARSIYKQFCKLEQLVVLLLSRLETTKHFTQIELKQYETYLLKLDTFLKHITRYNIKTNSGYNMFIKDVVSYNFDNTI